MKHVESGPPERDRTRSKPWISETTLTLKMTKKKAKGHGKGDGLRLIVQEDYEWVPITCANDMTACEFLEVWAERNGCSPVESVPGGLTLRTMDGEVVAFDTILSLVLLPGPRVYVEMGEGELLDDISQQGYYHDIV